jgi:hypothetical protein
MKRKNFGFSLFDCDGLPKSSSAKPISAKSVTHQTILKTAFPGSIQKILYFETCFAKMICKRTKP